MTKKENQNGGTSLPFLQRAWARFSGSLATKPAIAKSEIVSEYDLFHFLDEQYDGLIDRLAVTPLEYANLNNWKQVDISIGKQDLTYLMQTHPNPHLLNLELDLNDYFQSRGILPVPKRNHWRDDGLVSPLPVILYDQVEGEPLIEPILRDEVWTDEVYLEGVLALQAIDRDRLGRTQTRLGSAITALDVARKAYVTFKNYDESAAEEIYSWLQGAVPDCPEPKFSNGDLSPANFWVDESGITAVLDFTNAGFRDPIYDFLRTFIKDPRLQYRGLEERYCHMLGYSSVHLHWYRVLVNFEHLASMSATPDSELDEETAAGLLDQIREWVNLKAVLPV